jgi:hypothetical protein
VAPEPKSESCTGPRSWKVIVDPRELARALAPSRTTVPAALVMVERPTGKPTVAILQHDRPDHVLEPSGTPA